MIVSEPLLDEVFDPNAALRALTYAVLILGVLAAGRWAARRHSSLPQAASGAESSQAHHDKPERNADAV